MASNCCSNSGLVFTIADIHRHDMHGNITSFTQMLKTRFNKRKDEENGNLLKFAFRHHLQHQRKTTAIASF